MSSAINNKLLKSSIKSPQHRIMTEQTKLSPINRSRSNLAGIGYLSLQDYDRIKKNTVILSKISPSPQKDDSAETHKKKLLEIDSIKKQKENEANLSEIDLENIKKKNDLLKLARDKLDQELDIVKEMNKIMLYTQVQTVRDRQLEENKKLREISREQENKLDLLMELERLKDLQLFEDRENVKRNNQKKGAEVIIDQIKEREIQRKKQQEEVMKEKKEMIEKIKNIEEKEKIQSEHERIKKEKAIWENQEANRQSIELKRKIRSDEKDFELNLLKYQYEKAIKEDNEAKEKKRIKDEKEKEVQRLRERQEKAHDRMSDLQSFRAKRSIEDAERQFRTKELRELEVKRKRIEDFVSYNQKQKQEKEMLLAEQARMNELEFKKIVEKQTEDKEKEEKKIIDKRKLLVEHNLELRRQIKEKEEDEKMKIREQWEEGRKIKQGNIEEIKKYEEIKKEKIQQLKDMGINDKYIVDLEKLNVVPSDKLKFIKKTSKEKRKK